MYSTSQFVVHRFSMEHHHRVKRLKFDTLVVYPDATEHKSKTELYLKDGKRAPLAVAQSGPAKSSSAPPDLELQLPVHDDRVLNTYQQRILNETEEWERSRQSLLNIYFAKLVPSEDEMCGECCNEIGDQHVRCTDCRLFYCSTPCFDVTHKSNCLAFHKAESWKVCIQSRLYF